MEANVDSEMGSQTPEAMRARATSRADRVALGVTARQARTQLEDGDAPGPVGTAATKIVVDRP